jgi:beta-1,4-mannosyltransferase
MLELLLILWLLYVPSAVNLLVRIVKNWKEYEKHVDYKRVFNTPKIVFLIATKTSPKVVQATVKSINQSCHKIGYLKYEVMIVADSVSHRCNHAETYIVPDNYESTAKYKSRALQYMLDKHIPNRDDTWILHLDEESTVTEQCVRALLEHIEDGGALVAEGPINYPNDIRNILTLFLEGERSISCFYCVDQMKNSPVWMHGSNLLCNSKVEHTVGWRFGSSLAEDQRFAYEVEKKYGKVFGWHGGLIFEKPAFSVSDALKQRKRWFYGSIQNLKHLDLTKKTIQYYFLISWLVGFFSAVLSPITWLNIIPTALPIKIVLLCTVAFWLIQYQIGLYLNIRHTKMGMKQKVKYHILQFIMCPVVGLISTLPAALALIDPPRTFEIVKK